ncbi:MAG: hypothetical protein HQL08_03080 [Nitrospirae bacterium]|nr:hypothetical protein [Nitrospirota bacterium]
MKDKLNKFAENVTSQHGEDGILRYIIECLGDKIIRRSCEFGAWDGVGASNTYNLWFNKGWEGILIEGDERPFKKLLDSIKGKKITPINIYLTARGENSLDSIFRKYELNPKLGILSIDIDSFDYHVWKNIQYVDAQVVLVEFNQWLPPIIDYYDPEGELYLRCSAKALESLGAGKGYKLICCTKTNAIFIKDELFDPAFFPDYPVEHLFDWSEIMPILVQNGDGNKYPIWSTRNRHGFKFVLKIVYWISSRLSWKKKWRRPSRAVRDQLKKFGMDY